MTNQRENEGRRYPNKVKLSERVYENKLKINYIANKLFRLFYRIARVLCHKLRLNKLFQTL
jgi:hypothetical protein